MTSPEVTNALYRYFDLVQRGLDTIARSRSAPTAGGAFDPGLLLPARSEALERFFGPSRLTLAHLGTYRGSRISLLDLMGNPRTRTTKTFASLVIVARLVRHVQATGEPGLIVTPSSGNKATALRDAVLRALEAGLVEPNQLQITVVVPDTARSKLWSSRLVTDERLRDRNPVVVHAGAARSSVKELAQEAVRTCAPELRERAGVNVWYTLDLDNYRAGDVVRAAFEQEAFPPGPNGRLHVHAVSSAYGLLGHSFGWSLLDRSGGPGTRSRYLLVQHMETPDMVLSLHYGSPSREHVPAYHLNEDEGIYRQESDPRFPATTFDPAECLDTTFYTRRPPTSAAMNQLIHRNGGGGIVVSLHECLGRYAEIGALLAHGQVELPRDPRRLHEWSLVMAMTGVLNAIDRGLVEDDDILVHGSGSYADDQFEPLPAHLWVPVADAAELHRIIIASALAPQRIG